MKRIYLLSSFLALTFSVLASNNIRLQSVLFPTGSTKLSQSVAKQAAEIYNLLPERNFAKIQIKGEKEDDWARYDIIRLAKERAKTLQDYFIGIGMDAKNVQLDYNGIPRIILFKPKGILSVSGAIDLSSIEQQCFSIDSDERAYFTTKYGNVFVFEPGSFETSDGLPVSQKEISLCVWEFARTNDLIKGGVTNTDKGLKESASTFYVQAYIGDKELRINQGGQYEIYIPRPDDIRGFKANYGEIRDGNVSWVEDAQSYTYTSTFDEALISDEKSTIVTMRIGEDTSSTDIGAEEKLMMKAKSIGWVNCERVVNVAKPTAVEVVLQGATEEFAVRMVFKGRNIVIPGFINSNYQNKYEFNKVPSGDQVTVVAYRKVGGGYEVAYSVLTLGFTKTLSLAPTLMTEAEFSTFISEVIR